MGNVQVVCDSVASIPQELIDRHGIERASLWVIEDGTSRRELDMDVHEFYSRIRDWKEIPTSSQPSVEEFEGIFERAARAGRGVVGVFIAESMSGTLQAARIAAGNVAERHPGWAYDLVDTRCNSMETGFSVLAAARVADEGGSVEECAEAARETMARTRFVFTPEALEHLRKGGRIGNASALLGSILQIKPVLTVHEGTVETVAKVRTGAKAVQTVLDTFLADVQRSGLRRVYVHYIGDPKDAATWARDVVGPRIGREVEAIPVSPVVGVHVGPAMGIVYEADRPLISLFDDK